MSEFRSEIRGRMESARQSLSEARRDADEYLAGVREGELESLERLAAEHEAESAALRPN